MFYHNEGIRKTFYCLVVYLFILDWIGLDWISKINFIYSFISSFLPLFFLFFHYFDKFIFGLYLKELKHQYNICQSRI